MADAPLPQSTWDALAIVQQVQTQFPAFAPLLQIPEIASLLIEASKPGAQWSPAKLQAEIQGTNWWKTNSDTSKAWQVTKLVNPATAAEKQAQSATDIMHAAATAGIVLTPAQVTWLASAANEHAWTSAQLQEQIGTQANNGNVRAGSIRSDQVRLQGV